MNRRIEKQDNWFDFFVSVSLIIVFFGLRLMRRWYAVNLIQISWPNYKGNIIFSVRSAHHISLDLFGF